MPQITANMPDTQSVKQARRLALDAGVSLRVWAGAIIEKHLDAHRTALRSGDKMPKTRNQKLKS